MQNEHRKDYKLLVDSNVFNGCNRHRIPYIYCLCCIALNGTLWDLKLMTKNKWYQEWYCRKCGSVHPILKPWRKKPEEMLKCPNCGAKRLEKAGG